MFGGDNELGHILQEAVKIKSAQMNQKRRTYETWPYFVQHTLMHGEKDDFKAWRQLPFEEKMVISERLKNEGNELYKKGSWGDAVDKYEEAGGLVYYVYSTDPAWRKNNRGIDDDVLVLVDDTGSTADDAAYQKRLRLTLILNIAQAKLQLQKYEEAIGACDAALEMDPDNVKALYRRAEARVRPSKSTGYDHDLAIKDLSKAALRDPDNATVTKLLMELKKERKQQRNKDQKTFTGLFERGQLYDKAEEAAAEGDSAVVPKKTPAPDIHKRIEEISEEDSLEKRTADAELLRDLYMRNGKEDDARELNEKIQVAKKALKERNKQPDWDNPTPEMKESMKERPTLDWENPTDEMRADAKKYDLDLDDPLVIQELKRLEREGNLDDIAEKSDLHPDAVSGSGANTWLPGPEVDMNVRVPWLRYVALFASLVVAWRLVDAGALRWLLLGLWRQITTRILSLVGLGPTEDLDMDDDRGSLFASAYRKIATLLGGEGEEEL